MDNHPKALPLPKTDEEWAELMAVQKRAVEINRLRSRFDETASKFCSVEVLIREEQGRWRLLKSQHDEAGPCLLRLRTEDNDGDICENCAAFKEASLYQSLLRDRALAKRAMMLAWSRFNGAQLSATPAEVLRG